MRNQGLFLFLQFFLTSFPHAAASSFPHATASSFPHAFGGNPVSFSALKTRSSLVFSVKHERRQVPATSALIITHKSGRLRTHPAAQFVIAAQAAIQWRVRAFYICATQAQQDVFISQKKKCP
ncbi:hypothetical protein QN363_15970 [Undibacterium sp. CCC2.1]|uniref:hypothetical protein n=1 Tax=unclassified Undibacterium TaxID=2630295 RepID=UPI002B22D69D|nr:MULTISPECIES: hypothetical protein [unclassified Undibacterium]MEB0140525.1 hypothetical protein [Undibacterium sp. CCC2.1]MEB0173497.1 hypothetical protein [Undibacterium sp. CCC1.1]MEB0177483.1 hypothetical protein [Undibacterium sp. CCC3.4]MEB0216651.1 hypothetical protein [Undibacterium sp. 5I2]